MLLEFRAENHRSLREEQVLTMEAGRFGDSKDPRCRTVEGLDLRLLPAAAIYGANASGKSNVLSALGFLRDAVLDSHSLWPPQGGVPREAFAWGGFSDKPSLFELTILVDGVRYQYGVVLDQTRVLEEWLFSWPKGRRQTWLEREGDVFSFGDKLKGENRIIEQVTRSNSLFLSTAVQHKHRQLQPIHDWFRRMRTVRVLGYKARYSDAMPVAVASAMFASAAAAAAASSAQGGMVRVRELISLEDQDESLNFNSMLDASIAGRLRQLMKVADVGITNFRVDDDRNGAFSPKEKSPKVFVQHEAVDGDAWLPLDQESDGTRALFHLGPAVIEALDRGGLLVVDELEASLHPFVAMRLIGLFNSPLTNPRDAQIVFATHDTNLLAATVGDSILRRDQIWLTEKDRQGATTLYPLTDYKPRKEENLERGYLQGRYGGIPFLGDLDGMAE